MPIGVADGLLPARIARVGLNRAAAVNVAAPEIGAAGGAFRSGGVSGVIATPAAAGLLFSLRNPTGSGRLIVLRFLRVNYYAITNPTAQQEVYVDMCVARAWTVADSGGTAVALTGNQGKKRTSHATSIAEARIASTAALTSGTKTLDTNPVAAAGGVALAAAATVPNFKTSLAIDMTNGAEWPFVFVAGEGMTIRNGILGGAGGTFRCAVDAAWDEVDAATVDI